MTMRTKLIAKNGTLYYPETVLDHFGEPSPIVLVIYPEGDCDFIPWPMNGKWNAELASALYDAYESGVISERSVELPDGSVFDIDEHVE
jgi:hypothetical protein